MYKKPEDFDMSAALAFSREQAPAGVLAVMLTLQDRIADAVLLADQGAVATSTAYVVATHAGGLLALWGGTSLGRSLRRRRPVT